MTDYNPNLVYQIKKQATSTGMETALLLGSVYESSIGTDASAWYPGGVPDVGGQSYGPFFFRDPGALQDVMSGGGGQPPNNMTQAEAGAWITQPNAVNAVQAAQNRYQYVATTQGIDPNKSTYDAMLLTTRSEVGVGEENALASGSWQTVYTQQVQPLLGKKVVPNTLPSQNQPPLVQAKSPDTQYPTPIGPGLTSDVGAGEAAYNAWVASQIQGPAQQQGMSQQMAHSLDLAMNPTITTVTPNAQTPSQPHKSTGIFQDVYSWLGDIGKNIVHDPVSVLTTNYATQPVVSATEDLLTSPFHNINNVISATLVKLGIGLAGVVIMAAGLWLIVSTISSMGGGGTPMPVPVPV